MIEDLKNDILKGEDIGIILIKALEIATKLDLDDFKQWILNEMNGYDDFENLPDYRIVPCEVVYGFKNGPNITPISYSPHEIGLDIRIHEILTKRHLKLSISEISENYNNLENYVVLTVPQGVNDIINSISQVKVEVYQQVPLSKLKYIMDQVKSKIFAWCLELEKSGVVGFRNADKESAQNIIFNTIINIGSLNFTEINQDLNEIRNNVENIDNSMKNEIIYNIDIIQDEINKDYPDKSNLQKATEALKNLSMGVAESVIADVMIRVVLKVILFLSMNL